MGISRSASSRPMDCPPVSKAAKWRDIVTCLSILGDGKALAQAQPKAPAQAPVAVPAEAQAHEQAPAQGAIGGRGHFHRRWEGLARPHPPFCQAFQMPPA